MRILYAAGPGNVIGTFRYWQQGEEDPSQVSITFSSQFYDLCSSLDAEGYIIASHPERQFIKEGRFTLEHRPELLADKGGALYHLGQLLYSLRLAYSAIRFRADFVIVPGLPYLFILALLPKLGIQVIPTLHCTLWPKYVAPNKAYKLIWAINSIFFQKSCLAILSTSQDITEQIEKLTDGKSRPIIQFLSTYRRSEFENLPAPDANHSPFHVLFAGRIEENKGVFDLLEIAKDFKEQNINDIIFHVCGAGSALEELQIRANELNLTSSFICHGYCQKPQMRQMFSQAHVVIVPTKSDFNEGLNQVVVEGILTKRPVISSSVCPALSYVQEAVVEVPPNDIQAYAQAILRLKNDADFYHAKQASCEKLWEQFYDVTKSKGETLKAILLSESKLAHPAPGLQLKVAARDEVNSPSI